ncbi:hypothetical protein GW17_00044556 [Ensete ventricosum]|nr:hypothetical protein GW17_00044556 [Ensete ventricosum]
MRAMSDVKIPTQWSRVVRRPLTARSTSDGHDAPLLLYPPNRTGTTLSRLSMSTVFPVWSHLPRMCDYYPPPLFLQGC